MSASTVYGREDVCSAGGIDEKPGAYLTCSGFVVMVQPGPVRDSRREFNRPHKVRFLFCEQPVSASMRNAMHISEW